MTTPLWMLFGFALWTLVLLFSSVGIYRWSRILMGKEEAKTFRADQIEGADWYRRAMRAHANCLENLPIFAALVLILHVINLQSALINGLCQAVLIARIAQSLIHVSLTETNLTVYIRFFFYFSQAFCFFWLFWIVFQGDMSL